MAVSVALIAWFVAGGLMGPPSCNYDVSPVDRANCRATLRGELGLLSDAFRKDDGFGATGDEDVSNVDFAGLNDLMVGWAPDMFAPKLFPVESSMKVNRGPSAEQAGPEVTITWLPRCDQQQILTGGLTMQGEGTLTVRVETAFPCTDENGRPVAGKVRMCTQDLTSGMSTGLAVAAEGTTVLTMTCKGAVPCGVTLGRRSSRLPGKTECQCVDREPECE